MSLEFRYETDANKNFEANYYDHLSFFYKPKNGTNIPSSFLWDMYLPVPVPLKPIVRPFGRFNVHKTLHDGIDYVDELIGATIAPVACVLAAAYLITKTAANILTLAFFSDKTFLAATIGNLCSAIFALSMAVYCLIKSAVSLLTRPVLTAFLGYNQSTEERFCTGNQSPEELQETYTDLKDNFEHRSLIRPSADKPANKKLRSAFYRQCDEEEKAWHTQVRPMLGFGNN